ncbi:hypothetical protein Tco_0783156, partial [Tanacetum coccineum]
MTSKSNNTEMTMVLNSGIASLSTSVMKKGFLKTSPLPKHLNKMVLLNRKIDFPVLLSGNACDDGYEDGGDVCGIKLRVKESEVSGWLDRLTRSILEVAGKISPENFSGGETVWRGVGREIKRLQDQVQVTAAQDEVTTAVDLHGKDTK